MIQAPILVEIAPGELIDKIVILLIKSQRIADLTKLQHIRDELAILETVREQAIPGSAALTELTAELRAINGALWQIEDELRDCERNLAFGPRFIELARQVYQKNDRRASVKRAINELLGSRIVEEKSYRQYGT